MGMNSLNPLNKGKFLKRWMWDFLEGEIWGTCGFESLNFLSYEGRDPLDIYVFED